MTDMMKLMLAKGDTVCLPLAEKMKGIDGYECEFVDLKHPERGKECPFSAMVVPLSLMNDVTNDLLTMLDVRLFVVIVDVNEKIDYSNVPSSYNMTIVVKLTGEQSKSPMHVEELYGLSKESFTYKFHTNKIDDVWSVLWDLEFAPSTQRCEPYRPLWFSRIIGNKVNSLIVRVFPRIRSALNHYACTNNKIISSDDVTFLGQGGYNIVLRVQDEPKCLRICLNAYDFVISDYKLAQTCDAFQPIHDIVNIKQASYLVLSLMKDIPEPCDANKMKTCVHKLIEFLYEHQEVAYTDCWTKNFVCSLDDSTYYVGDLELTMNLDEQIKHHLPGSAERYESYISNGYTKISYNPQLYVDFCAKYELEPTYFVCSFISLKLFELSGWQNSIRITHEIETTLITQLRRYVRPIDLTDDVTKSLWNWANGWSKWTCHTYNVLRVMCLNPSAYEDMQQRFERFNHTINTQTAEELFAEVDFCRKYVGRTESEYLAGKIMGINFENEFKNLINYIDANGGMTTKTLYRYERTKRFNAVKVGDEFDNLNILTASTYKSYVMDLFGVHNVTKIKEEQKVFMILNHVKAAEIIFPGDKCTVYRRFVDPTDKNQRNVFKWTQMRELTAEDLDSLNLPYETDESGNIKQLTDEWIISPQRFKVTRVKRTDENTITLYIEGA